MNDKKKLMHYGILTSDSQNESQWPIESHDASLPWVVVTEKDNPSKFSNFYAMEAHNDSYIITMSHWVKVDANSYKVQPEPT